MKALLPLIFFIFTSCQPEAPAEAPAPAPTSPKEVKQLAPPPSLIYLALGDSYTIGESVRYQLNYPNQLADRLRADRIQVADPVIIAETGWTTGDLAASIKRKDPAKNFSLVSLAIGVNNQFQGQSIERYELEFKQLLNQAIEFAGGNKQRVFVLSIPDYGQTPYGQRNSPENIAAELDKFNAVNRRITKDLGIVYFDITPISRKGVDEPDLVAPDGLHPSAKQYQKWVESLYQDIKAMSAPIKD
ncbi:MAG: SGNH/GDSL hydrolase family protein [Verrucomicrobiales bacterium]|nr:SGNH/GDSL hydrolase family protein [Verrucomicrobiales bacterium]